MNVKSSSSLDIEHWTLDIPPASTCQRKTERVPPPPSQRNPFQVFPAPDRYTSSFRTAQTAACVRSDADLAEDVLNVLLDGLVADVQRLGNLLVRQAVGELPQDFALALVRLTSTSAVSRGVAKAPVTRRSSSRVQAFSPVAAARIAWINCRGCSPSASSRWPPGPPPGRCTRGSRRSRG